MVISLSDKTCKLLVIVLKHVWTFKDMYILFTTNISFKKIHFALIEIHAWQRKRNIKRPGGGSELSGHVR